MKQDNNQRPSKFGERSTISFVAAEGAARFFCGLLNVEKTSLHKNHYFFFFYLFIAVSSVVYFSSPLICPGSLEIEEHQRQKAGKRSVPH